MSSNPLKAVEVFTFDVFGTVVDWLNTGVRVLKEKSKVSQDPSSGAFTDAGAWLKSSIPCSRLLTDGILLDWVEFMREWRNGYRERTYVPESPLLLEWVLIQVVLLRVSAGLHGLGGRTLSVDRDAQRGASGSAQQLDGLDLDVDFHPTTDSR